MQLVNISFSKLIIAWSGVQILLGPPLNPLAQGGMTGAFPGTSLISRRRDLAAEPCRAL